MLNIGVLALQGAFKEHSQILQRLGVSVCEVRLPNDLQGIDGVILPGGETTAQRRLAHVYGLWEPIREMALRGIPVFGTCAGLILMAKKVDGKEGLSLDLMDIDVKRNAYGRQVHSFELSLPVPLLNHDCPAEQFRAIFIRAPQIVRVGSKVQILASYQDQPVAVQQGKLLALCFHPELTPDDRFHRYFLDIVEHSRGATTGHSLAS